MTSQQTFTCALPDPQATQQFGEALATHLRAGDLIVLTGDLGAGKTTMTKGIGRGLGVRGSVASPTFIIAREHPPLGDGPGLVHVDAYRLGSLEEVDALDLDTSLDECVTVVEWGSGLVDGLATDRLDIVLTRPHGGIDTNTTDLDGAEGGERTITLTAHGDRWTGIDLESLTPSHRETKEN